MAFPPMYRKSFHQCLTMIPVVAIWACIPYVAAASDEEAVQAWKDETATFHVGIAASRAIPKSAAQYERFRQALSDQMDMSVTIFVAADMAALVDAVASGRVDYAPMSALGYLTADDLCRCVAPIVAPTTAEGGRAIQSVLYGVDDAARQLSELADGIVVSGPPMDVMRTIVPAIEFEWNGKALAQSGLHIQQADDSETLFARVADGSVSAVFGWAYSDSRADDQSSPFGDRLAEVAHRMPTVLWRSSDYLFGPHVVAASMPEKIQRELRSWLLGLHSSNPLVFDEISGNFGGPLQAVDASRYQNWHPVFEAIRADHTE